MEPKPILNESSESVNSFSTLTGKELAEFYANTDVENEKEEAPEADLQALQAWIETKVKDEAAKPLWTQLLEKANAWLAEEKERLVKVDWTEMAQADMIAELLYPLVKHTNGQGWQIYSPDTGAFQKEHAQTTVFEFAKLFAWQRRIVAFKQNDKDLKAFAKSLCARRSLNAVMDIMDKSLSLYVLDTAFNKNRYLLNCKGLTVDLQTGERRESTPHDMHTQSAGYRPQAGDTPVFDKFTREITLDRQDLYEWLMTYLGYSLTGETREQIFCNFAGAGSNGKGRLIGLIKKIMGSYAGELSTEAILQRGNNRFSLGNIVGYRLMVAPDVPKGTLNMENIKTLTGEDTITIEQKYRDAFSYRPQAKLIFSTNDPLHLTEHGAAIRRRLRLIPFDFTPPEPDKALEAKLEAEAPFILDKLIKYAVQYYKDGFPSCRTVEDASKDFVDSQDTVKQFLNECVIEEAGASCGKTELYIAFRNWDVGQGTKESFVMKNRSFWERLDKMYTPKREAPGWIYHNIKLKPLSM